jgi:N6-L-threonylcarbamoyladenine synthase
MTIEHSVITDTAQGKLILGIESSCDETAASVVRGGTEILSSIIHSQAEEHAQFGGVVPEIAGRSHLREVHRVIREALREAKVSPAELAGVAVTVRPGLIGSLLVGLSAAKGFALRHRLPLIPVHHIHAHVWAATMELTTEAFPAIALVVSGGHTALYRAESPREFTPLAQTLDDAAGEAFDKVAWILGLAYPGGPSISKLAEEGDPSAFRFPRYRPKALPNSKELGLERPLGFSFSGLKTSVLYHVRGQDALADTPAPSDIPRRADVAASFQEAVVDALVNQAVEAASREGLDRIFVAGGVACNKRLREKMTAAAIAAGKTAIFPSPAYCSDNAAMIAGLGWPLYEAGATSDLTLDASPR